MRSRSNKFQIGCIVMRRHVPLIPISGSKMRGFALYPGNLTNLRRAGRAKENAMIAIHRFAKLAGSVAIAAMIVPAHSLAESSGGAGAGTAGGSPSATGGGYGAGRTLSPGAPLRPSSPAAAPGAATSETVTPQRNDSARTNPATDTEIPGTTDSKAGASARRTETSPEISGAPPQADTQAPIGTAGGRKRVRAGSVTPETSGGSARQRASGSTMENCMAAWDEKTHMTQDRWRETCQRTLDENL
jgi:hypothetical protein